MLKRYLLAGTAALGLAATTSLASEVNLEHISPNADWFAHFDFEKAANSKIFAELGETAGNTESNARPRTATTSPANQQTETASPGTPNRFDNWLEKRYGIKVSDLHGLTVYAIGGGEDKQTFSLLYGEIEQDKLITAVKQQTEIQSRNVGDETIYFWTLENKDIGTRQQRNQPNQPQDRVQPRQPNAPAENPAGNNAPASNRQQPQVNATVNASRDSQTIAVAFFDDVTVFGNSVQAVEQAITQIDRKEGLAQKVNLEKKELPENTFVYAMVLDMGQTGQPANDQAAAAWSVLGEVETASVAIGDLGSEQAFIAVEAKAKSEEAAKQVGDIFEGLQALAAISDTEASDLNLGGVAPEVQQSGQFLRMGWTVNVDRLAQIIDERFNMQMDSAEVEGEEIEVQVRNPGTTTQTVTDR